MVVSSRWPSARYRVKFEKDLVEATKDAVFGDSRLLND